jgi:hypothetical protein
MQMDMHFYGVYALARAAGVKPETARLIAYASQFVDDAIESDHVVLPGGSSAVLPIVTSHKPTDFENVLPGDQWEVWVPFHFLPGNDPNGRTFMERMVCLKGGALAKQMLQDALNYKSRRFGPHLAGVAAHVYADTYAHYGFVGLCTKLNKVRHKSIEVEVQSPSMERYLLSKFEALKTRIAGSAAETVPLGHGSVATFPDRPFLNWQYEYENRPLGPVVRENPVDFLKASEDLHAFFAHFVKDNPTHGPPLKPVSWNSIASHVQQLIKTEGHLDDRIELWRKSIASSALFEATEDDKFIRYSDRLWKPNSVFCDPASAGSAEYSDPCLYIRAAKMHRDYVLDELLPRNGIVVS